MTWSDLSVTHERVDDAEAGVGRGRRRRRRRRRHRPWRRWLEAPVGGGGAGGGSHAAFLAGDPFLGARPAEGGE